MLPECLDTIPDDPLLKLIDEFRKDQRGDKIDLGVGVYRDETGQTPVMAAVKLAEHQIIEQQNSKAYLGLAGDLEFVEELRNLAFDQLGSDEDRFIGMQTPGSSAALRLAGDLLKRTKPDASIWIGDPCWANHIPIFKMAGLNIQQYPYYDHQKHIVDSDSFFSALSTVKTGDAILLQGCCHNPSGADLSQDDWIMVSELCVQRGLIPIVDIAYQGLGCGLAEDMRGLNHLLKTCPEVILTLSCSKNFGLYRERTGGIFVLAETTQKADKIRSNLFDIARTTYSMPPDHGAAVVRTILKTPAFRKVWENELTGMRDRILSIRKAIVKHWKSEAIDLSYLQKDQGMFSLLTVNPAQVETLKLKHGIYMAGNGRINIAGLRNSDIARFANVVDTVLAASTMK